MRYEEYPRQVSDPAAEGLPDTADHDSSAFDEVETGRVADGPDPAALPADAPTAVDRTGVTAEEQRAGESLDARLAQEEPDTPLDEPLAPPPTGPAYGSGGYEPIDENSAERIQRDADVLEPGPRYEPDTQVSLYDKPLAGTPDEPVGRLVEPDGGGLTDDEPDAIATDAGSAGGGPSAEELAIHRIPAPD